MGEQSEAFPIRSGKTLSTHLLVQHAILVVVIFQERGLDARPRRRVLPTRQPLVYHVVEVQNSHLPSSATTFHLSAVQVASCYGAQADAWPACGGHGFEIKGDHLHLERIQHAVAIVIHLPEDKIAQPPEEVVEEPATLQALSSLTSHMPKGTVNIRCASTKSTGGGICQSRRRRAGIGAGNTPCFCSPLSS